MVNVAQSKFEQFIRKDTGSVREAKERMICKDRPKTHGPSMEDSFMTETTETRVAVYNFDTLANHDVSKDREEGKNRRERSFSIDDQKWDVIHFQSIREVAYSGPSLIGMSYNHNLMTSVYELLQTSELPTFSAC